jgi:large subunit ribosomal protein L25
MVVDAVLKYDLRSVGKAENVSLIKNNYLLGSICGKGMESVSIALKKDELKKTLKKYGRNCIIKLESNSGESYEVIVKAVQSKNYDYHHVDFQKVAFTDLIKADVTVKYIGVEFLQPKRLILNRIADTVPVSGLPLDIPHFVEYDVSNVNAGDNIYVNDLVFAEGIKPEVDENHMIGSIIAV